MGIDLPAHGRRKHGIRKTSHTTDPYKRILYQTFKFLDRRTESPFCELVAHRLTLSNTNRPPVSVRKLASLMSHRLDNTAVVVGTVTADDRTTPIPAMKVCALRFTRRAEALITKNGGSCISFDKLVMENPRGNNTVILQGKRSHREAVKHFGKPSAKHSHTKPKSTQKGGFKGRGNHHKGW
eukprot:gnl/Chilomastix_caulleri/662.p1 GENE.gnl/Chilomastix_caulleri/662~~gnl/Chilomastix_caulleri/662.p1  ORF type:complete len:182 (-),score=39.45 gnl/Chilomastix_caulleri/662:149-694(-)